MEFLLDHLEQSLGHSRRLAMGHGQTGVHEVILPVAGDPGLLGDRPTNCWNAGCGVCCAVPIEP